MKSTTEKLDKITCALCWVIIGITLVAGLVPIFAGIVKYIF